MTANLGLYIHIPFCARKCPYCDFNTYAGLDGLHDRTVDALCAELTRWGALIDGRPLTTVFIGGGTPTLLNAPQLTRLFEHLHGAFTLAPGCEITSEANPGAVDRAKFAHLRGLGVNRLSMGVQSFQPAELDFLGRIHDTADVYRAYDSARAAGFDNINLDFIFGLPRQTAIAWRDTLHKALALAPEHLSLYSLIVEPETPLFHWVQTGQVAAPDEDDAATHYELAMETLGAAGYAHYEVSNWAQPGAAPSGQMPAFACRHNLTYWRNEEYLGIGPGAHSHMMVDGRIASAGLLDTDPAAQGDGACEARWGNHKPVAGYVKRVMAGASIVAFREHIEQRLSMAERMMLGLRLVGEGVPLESFAAHYDVSLTDVFAAELARLSEWGLIELDAVRVRLTPQGLMLGNQVFAHFLPDR